ncbi:hypothetical protein CTAYLR_007295 [Chrysophaeum taylorii]|uniref:CREG-like beta-barrel domain-containing protein n=1 Tax=Chrysophaeum taylorii TaxID=2483200 RepID=A0AAD7UIW1_9STRA|nr:hypothetical protein CTAYLR_007295 [Chrysophaeum taylorii]
MLLWLIASASANPRPPFWEKASYARWMTGNHSWGIMSTISTMDTILGSPFGNPVSYADNYTGVPYMCVSGLDQSIIDLQTDSRMSLTISEAVSRTSACKPSSYGDPENPPCARLSLTGTFANVTGDEWDTAAAALKAKHPAMENWGCFGGSGIPDHGFYVAKLQVDQAWLIDIYGGASVLTADDYFGVDGLLSM